MAGSMSTTCDPSPVINSAARAFLRIHARITESAKCRAGEVIEPTTLRTVATPTASSGARTWLFDFARLGTDEALRFAGTLSQKQRRLFFHALLSCYEAQTQPMEPGCYVPLKLTARYWSLRIADYVATADPLVSEVPQ